MAANSRLLLVEPIKRELKIYYPAGNSIVTFYIYKACLDAYLYAILSPQVVMLPDLYEELRCSSIPCHNDVLHMF